MVVLSGIIVSAVNGCVERDLEWVIALRGFVILGLLGGCLIAAIIKNHGNYFMGLVYFHRTVIGWLEVFVNMQSLHGFRIDN